MAGLVPPSTSLLPRQSKDVDARVKPGHDVDRRSEQSSPVEKLPQDVVHWLTVLLRGRIARHRRGSGLGRSGLGRRWCGRGRALDAALAARPRAALALALAQSAQALLQEIAEGLAELAAERTARLLAASRALSAGAALLSAGRPRLSAEQAADRGAKPGAVLAEQALAHLLQLAIGGLGIVEDALHLRIDPWATPRARDHHGDAEPDRIAGAALALGGHHELRLDAEADLLGAEIDSGGAGYLDQRADQSEIGGLRLALVDLERRRQLREVRRLLFALLPARQGARRQRADHLRDVEALDGAVLEYDEGGAGHVRHDRALAGAGGAQAELRLHLAVELVEIGEALQQRKRAHAGEVGPHREDRIGGGDIDGQIAIGVTLIGAEVGNLRLEDAASKRGLDRGGGEARVADVELGRGNARLHVDVIEAVDVDRRTAPGLCRSIAGAARRRDGELLEIEVEFHQRLARQIDRGPAVER